MASTGLRRYLDANRNQLWAEALAVYKSASDPIRLPAELGPAQAQQNEKHRRSDSLIEDAVAMLKPRMGAKLRELMVAADVVSASGPLDRRTEARFVNALKMQGWVKGHTREGNRWEKHTKGEGGGGPKREP